MNTKKITALIFSMVIGASLVAFLKMGSVSAQTTVQVNTSTNVGAISRLSKIIARSDTAIAARITSLSALNIRIEGLKNVSTTEKTNISNEVQTNNNGLSSLKAKIDTDTDITSATNDEKSIYGSYRIYALVIPQGYIEASADRVNTIVGILTTMSTKLQARITNERSAGKDVSALQASLAELNAKIADATTQATTVQTSVGSLTPDQGNKTQLDANTAALKTARANIKIASQDLQTARQDAKTIIKGLKVLNVKASANTSASANTTTQ